MCLTCSCRLWNHGTLTDNNGRKADFRNVILIMTTNAGAENMSRSSIGFTTQDHSVDGGDAIKKTFTPEFRNRLDSVIQFKPLSPEVITHVVDKQLTELQSQLDDKKVQLDVNDDVRKWLAERGYDRLMGARPMARLIQDQLKKPMAEAILFGDLVKGGTLKVSLKDDELVFETESG